MEHKFIPFADLCASRQKALQAANGWRIRAEQQMNDTQMDYGTHSPEYAVASMRFESALECYNNQVARTQMPGHPLYVSEASATAYQRAIIAMECPHCQTSLGVNPQDGKLGCPYVACCAA